MLFAVGVRHGQTSDDVGRNCGRRQLASRLHQAPDGHNSPLCHRPPLVFEQKLVGDARSSDRRHGDGDVEFIAKPHGRAVVARHGNTRPAAFTAVWLPLKDMQTSGPHQFVLSRLHPEKECREVRDTSGIRVSEFNSATGLERSHLAPLDNAFTGHFSVTGRLEIHARSPVSPNHPVTHAAISPQPATILRHTAAVP